ncbi:MAG: hypothetical protein KF729_38900 [Sandaracinaceae bacterium]|nr:hypothetical protein [Sandaracinaceae bacterium]
MTWSLDKSSADWSRWHRLTPTEQRKWDSFQNAVSRGSDPQSAASLLGAADYKCLAGDQYQIRLSQKNRATFRVDRGTQTVTVLQVGGHT